MSSFFTVPGAQKKRKRTNNDGPSARKRPAGASVVKRPSKPQPSKRVERETRDDESISSGSEDAEDPGHVEDPGSGSESERDETAAEKRLRLAEAYLSKVREDVDTTGFDAEEIDKDMIAARLEEDIGESKGKVFRRIAADLDYESTRHTWVKHNTASMTAVALCNDYLYTVSKDGVLIQWKLQPLPENQYPQTTRKKPKRQAPPRKRPQRLAIIKGNYKKAKDKNYKGHVGQILCVAASQDGKFVVTGGSDNRLIVWSVHAKGLKMLKTFFHHRDDITGLVFRRGTNTLYSCSRDRTVKVFNLDALAYVESLFGHADHVVDIDALGQERCISVGSRDRTVRLWKVIDESQLVFRASSGTDKKKNSGVDPRSLAETGSLDCCAYIDDQHWVTGSDNGALSLWSIARKRPLHVIPLAHGIEDPLLPSEVSAEANPNPKVVPPPQPRWITSLTTLPYSNLILSGSTDGYIRAWSFNEEDKTLSPAGILGQGNLASPQEETQTNGVPSADGDEMDTTNDNEKEESEIAVANNGEECPKIRGVINNIAVTQRGGKNSDSLTIVAAVGVEHRLGSWMKMKGSRNGAVIYELRHRPRKAVNGVNGVEKMVKK
ncbi:WD40 repeat-like protein [Xylariaceae sp. FL0255]|nr:WD40 repeat-like protein [Xylariaceae sp. FL0255]